MVLLVDSIAPTVLYVTSSTADGSYIAGNLISIQVTFSEVVFVTGTPQLTLETGDTDAVVDYTSGSESNVLTFEYTVAAGDTSSDLDYVSTTALSVNSGTIKDAAGNDATLTLATPGTTGSLSANQVIVIDTTAPSVDSFTMNDRALKIGDTSTVTLVFSEEVTDFSSDADITVLNGNLSIMTSDDNITWTGTYTPTAGIEDTTNVLTLATNYTDTAGNAGPSNTTLNYTVDTLAPALNPGATVTLLNGSGTGNTSIFIINDTISITITWNQSLTVSGTPILNLSNGSTATYDSGTGTSALLFKYTVASGDTYANPLSISNWEGTITDGAGNTAAPCADTLTNIIVDANEPSITNLTATDGTYAIGNNIDIIVTWSQSVTVNNAPTLTLSNETTATYFSGTGGTSTIFRYTVVENDTNTTDLSVSSYNETVSAYFKSANGNAVQAYNSSTSLGSIIVDGDRPTATVSATDGTYGIDDNIDITVSWNENVTVPSNTILNLSNGKTATYISGTGGTSTIFRYTVVENDNNTTNLSVSNYATGTITDTAGNTPALATEVSGDLGSVSVDAVRPTVTTVSATDGTYIIGNDIEITVSWSEDVTVSNDTVLNLSNVTTATYSSGTGGTSIIFTYTVVEDSTGSNNTSDLSVDSYTGTITDTGGNAPTSTTSVSGDLGTVIVDAQRPTVTSISATEDMYIIGESFNITVSWSENVTVSNDTVLNLSGFTDGANRTATYSSGTGGTSIIFTYTVSEDTSGDSNGTDLTVVNYATGTITDTAGNTPALATEVSGSLGSVNVDALRPAFVSISADDGMYIIGDTLTVTVTWDDNVYISTPNPKITLSNFNGGGTKNADYLSGDGTTSLKFKYTCDEDSTGDSNSSGVTVTGYTTGTIKDINGNEVEAIPTSSLGSI